NEPQYIEWNISPSRAYAAYLFESYRVKKEDIRNTVVSTQITSTATQLIMSTQLECPFELLDSCEVMIAAVLKTKSKHLTHWAIRHSSPPDFHRRELYVKI